MSLGRRRRMAYSYPLLSSRQIWPRWSGPRGCGSPRPGVSPASATLSRSKKTAASPSSMRTCSPAVPGRQAACGRFGPSSHRGFRFQNFSGNRVEPARRVTKHLDTWESASLEGLISPPVGRVCQYLPQFPYLVLQPGYFLCGQGSHPSFDPVQLLSILRTFRLPPSNVEVLQQLSKAFCEFLEGFPAWCPAKQAPHAGSEEKPEEDRKSTRLNSSH